MTKFQLNEINLLAQLVSNYADYKKRVNPAANTEQFEKLLVKLMDLLLETAAAERNRESDLANLG